MGPIWVSVLLLMDGSFLPFFSKRVLSPFSPTPIRVTERPLLKDRNFSVIIGGTSVNMAKGGTKCTQCCGNSVATHQLPYSRTIAAFVSSINWNVAWRISFLFPWFGKNSSCAQRGEERLEKTHQMELHLPEPELCSCSFLSTFLYVIWKMAYLHKILPNKLKKGFFLLEAVPFLILNRFYK